MANNAFFSKIKWLMKSNTRSCNWTLKNVNSKWKKKMDMLKQKLLIKIEKLKAEADKERLHVDKELLSLDKGILGWSILLITDWLFQQFLPKNELGEL